MALDVEGTIVATDIIVMDADSTVGCITMAQIPLMMKRNLKNQKQHNSVDLV
ncbi:MAG: hypothetical protein GY943_10090 [Chloroflexi bacterium]|nr:hypothetical protein [Chloroflexota bacterium]